MYFLPYSGRCYLDHFTISWVDAKNQWKNLRSYLELKDWILNLLTTNHFMLTLPLILPSKWILLMR